jgi:hypothetical protein
MAKKMRVIYHKWYEGDDIGEADAFFEVIDGNLLLITCWSANDANWRGEYMEGLLRYFGVQVKNNLPAKFNSDAEALVKEAFGI